MININLTAKSIEFTSTASGSIELTEPRWEAVDEYSFHVSTEQGVYLISITENELNKQKFKSSQDALGYLNSL